MEHEFYSIEFSREELQEVGNTILKAEEQVNDFFKLSLSDWLKTRYDIKTRRDLEPHEISGEAFAEIFRYADIKDSCFIRLNQIDYYKICLQDHNIIKTINRYPTLHLSPFVFYITTHELVHVVRFVKFQQGFFVSETEKEKEERRVHNITIQILKPWYKRSEVREVIDFFSTFYTGNTESGVY